PDGPRSRDLGFARNLRGLGGGRRSRPGWALHGRAASPARAVRALRVRHDSAPFGEVAQDRSRADRGGRKDSVQTGALALATPRRPRAAPSDGGAELGERGRTTTHAP